MREFMGKKINIPKLNPPQWTVLVIIVLCLGLFFWDLSDNSLCGSLSGENPVVAVPDSGKSSAEDVVAVSATTEEADAFFASYRLEREQTRAQELELLENTLSSTESSVEAKSAAEAARLDIVKIIEGELLAENIIFAKGLGENVVLLGINQATVFIDGEVDQLIAAQIAEIVDGACDVGYENVIVVKR